MTTVPGSRLLPGRLDTLARGSAPRWPAADLGDGPTSGSGLRLLRQAFWLLLLAAALQSVLHVANLVLFEQQIDRFNADWDGSVAGWLGTITTWSAAGGALLLALLTRALRTPMLLLAGVCAFLSLDDMLQLHEVVARMAPDGGVYGHAGYTLWPLVYLPLLGVAGWLILRTAHSIEPTTGRCLVAGLACLAAAVALEASAPALYALGSDRGQPLYESEVMVEEALETVGWGLVALSLLAACIDLLLARGAGGALPPARGMWRAPGGRRALPAHTSATARQDAVPHPNAAHASPVLRHVERRTSGDRRRQPAAPLDG